MAIDASWNICVALFGQSSAVNGFLIIFVDRAMTTGASLRDVDARLWQDVASGFIRNTLLGMGIMAVCTNSCFEISGRKRTLVDAV
jgi:hypothetical protein